MQTTRTPSTMRTASSTGDGTNQINEPDTAAAQTAPPGLVRKVSRHLVEPKRYASTRGLVT